MQFRKASNEGIVKLFWGYLGRHLNIALYSIEEKPTEGFRKLGFPGMESTEDNILVGDMYLVK